MSKLSFFDVDKDYIDYLQREETRMRGFTRVPNVAYGGNKKFLCGIVLELDGLKYYVPVSSYKQKQSENLLIVLKQQKTNKVVGSLRFNYMIPVSDENVMERIIKNEPDPIRKRFLSEQLRFCNASADHITTLARRTYNNVVNNISEQLTNNSCMFKFLEKACVNYKKNL